MAIGGMGSYIEVLQALANLPQSQATRLAPALPPMDVPANLPPIATPGEPGSSSLAFAPVTPDPTIMQQLMQFAPPRPVEPVAQPVSTLQKIALALQGFGAGVQGRGPQFLAQLQEQREKPQREYRQQVERYEDVTRQLGVRGVEETRRDVAERKREQLKAERDLQDFMRQQEAILGEQLFRERQAELKRMFDEKQERIKAEAAAQKEQERKEKEVRARADKFKDRPRTQAIRWARLEVSGEPLQPGDQKAYDKYVIDPDKPKGSGSGAGGFGGVSTDGIVRQFEALKARFLTAERNGDRGLQDRIAAQFPKIMGELEKRGYQVGYDPSFTYPYVKPRGQAPAVAPASASAPATRAAAPAPDPLGIR
ncbi:MAG: hypothetical protein L0220_01115 [Acidobacteria bacterium]|nr:hypothetical protein [Acidobacteriota bacterium]